ncbi:MAG: hypothetical protein GX573_22135 [Chloroflexi bacterium]|nr:hypothetical protein [Chloroflexota bacterium]
MSKRSVAILTLVVLFALAVMVFAVAPALSEPASEMGHPFALFRLDQAHSLYDPQCPPVAGPGCGGP